MTLRIPVPRLLPATIAMLAVVLVAKSGFLVHTAITSGQPIAAAWAAGSEAPAPTQKPAAAAAEKKPATPEPPIAEAVPSGPPPVTDSEKAVLLELRERRRELETREATLAARESMLAAAETKLSERVGQLQALQKKLESLDASHRQQEDVAWQGLVKVYEAMKPRDAAAIFNDLGMPVLLSVVGRMKEAKAAAVLAAMLPEKARDVTTQLALSRTKAASSVESGDTPSLTPEPVKTPPEPPSSGT